LNYKEALFFVAKCLTISLEEKNRDEIETILQTIDVDWDTVVKVSTSHYVFPALYCNLKRANFLKYVPKDLLGYMAHITELNRKRNLQIIKQGKELNDLLLANNITPIFLKGTGNLLGGLYDDIAERMVGDIDFIVNKNHIKSLKILLSDSGYNVNKMMRHFHRHESRLVNENYIAAVEVHKELLREKYSQEFDYDLIYKEIQEINGVMVLSFDHQLALSIFAQQINDFGYDYKNITLRNAYDVFILSKKTNLKRAILKFSNLRHPMNCFLASCYITFGKIDSLEYEPSKEIEKYLCTFNNLLLDVKKSKSRRKLIDKKIFIEQRIRLFYRIIFHKEYRVWLFNRILDKNWQSKKLVQLGFKKS